MQLVQRQPMHWQSRMSGRHETMVAGCRRGRIAGGIGRAKLHDHAKTLCIHLPGHVQDAHVLTVWANDTDAAAIAQVRELLIHGIQQGDQNGGIHVVEWTIRLIRRGVPIPCGWLLHSLQLSNPTRVRARRPRDFCRAAAGLARAPPKRRFDGCRWKPAVCPLSRCARQINSL